MSELLVPKPQPKFPHEDVSEVNAQIFEQLLLEPEYILAAHELAEQQVEAFKLGHSTLRSLGYVLYKDGTQQRAFSFGATVYEALSTTVRPLEQTLSLADKMQIQRKTGAILAYRDDTASAIMNILDEEDRFIGETPVAAGLVGTAADFYPEFDKRLVLWGAALERSIDVDVLKTAA